MRPNTEETLSDRIDAMLAATTFAVVGASTNPEKYGHIAYVDLKRFGKTVYPVNPRAAIIDGDPCYPSIAALPGVPDVVVAVIPPLLTERLVDELAAAGVGSLWIQPGAESAVAVAKAHAAGIRVVSGGPCVMVSLRTHLPMRPRKE